MGIFFWQLQFKKFDGNSYTWHRCTLLLTLQFLHCVRTKIQNTFMPMRWVIDGLQARLTNLETVFKILVKIQLSKSAGERSFSSLKCVKIGILVLEHCSYLSVLCKKSYFIRSWVSAVTDDSQEKNHSGNLIKEIVVDPVFHVIRAGTAEMLFV
jgi:hypothetical protein